MAQTRTAAGELAARLSAAGRLEKPPALVKAERELLEARRARADAEAEVVARQRKRFEERATGMVADGLLAELQRRLEAAQARVATAWVLHENAQRAAAIAWHATYVPAASEIVGAIEELLSEVATAIAPLAEAADAFAMVRQSPPPVIAAGRQIAEALGKLRKGLAHVVVSTADVRFLRNVTIVLGESEQSFEQGRVYSLPAPSAQACIRRGWAQDADQPYAPPAVIAVKFLSEYAPSRADPRWPEAGTKFTARQVVELEEQLARQLIETGVAEPIEPSFWDALAGGARAAAAAIGTGAPNGVAKSSRASTRAHPN